MAETSDGEECQGDRADEAEEQAESNLDGVPLAEAIVADSEEIKCGGTGSEPNHSQEAKVSFASVADQSDGDQDQKRYTICEQSVFGVHDGFWFNVDRHWLHLLRYIECPRRCS